MDDNISKKRQRNLSEPTDENRKRVYNAEGKFSNNSCTRMVSETEGGHYNIPKSIEVVDEMNDHHSDSNSSMDDEGKKFDNDEGREDPVFDTDEFQPSEIVSNKNDRGKEPNVSVVNEEKEEELRDNRGTFFEHFFHDSLPIDFEFDGNSLHAIGNNIMAKRIEKKFKIMQKLAHLIGCGLDCHFRLAHSEFKLLMMVRGAPRVLFGSAVSVVPDPTNIRKYATAGQFIEDAQATFFESILQLMPRNLESIETTLKVSLFEGTQDMGVSKLYDFLRNIRQTVLTYVSKVPIVWTVQDVSSQEHHFDLSPIRNEIKQCGEMHLLKLENDHPGFTDRWCSECGVGRAQTFSEFMEKKFNTFN
ncbi:hypothetical protein CRE_23891 [Caenorhabditis remanei]|uniref:Uncharacterized protein n=1 Tax=Caenorhabditis remanei TaxID=31234 RepID=E3MGA4_CAERE|nr:hypothetical protein CRE_23891 [Caenorhabditis remanei]